MPNTLTRVSGYMSDGILDYDMVLDVARQELQEVHFDTMVGVGLSGALVVPRLARDLNKHWAIVRKPDDSKHARTLVEGTIGREWLFVDDCIESGSTWDLAQDRIESHLQLNAPHGFDSKYAGAYTYAWNVGYHPVGSLDMEGYWK